MTRKADTLNFTPICQSRLHRTPLFRSVLRPIKKMAGAGLILLALMSLSTPGMAYSLVSFSSETSNTIVTEGYAGDVEKLLKESDLAKAVGELQPRHNFHDEETLIVSIGSSVYSDTDHDGFFTHFSITFDVDTPHSERDIYARLWIRSDDTEYELFHTTNRYQIYGSLESDTFRIESKLLNNYPAGYYDLKLDVMDAHNDTLLDTVDAETHRTLFALPLESTMLDDGFSRDQLVHEHVGAAAFLPLFLLVLGGFRRLFGASKSYGSKREHG